MRTPSSRRPVHGALALIVVLLVLVAAPPAEARSPRAQPRAHPQKIEPRRMTPYRVGRFVTVNTDILSPSGYAAWMIDEVLAKTTPLPRLGSAFTAAERREGVNARYFLAHAMLESGWGTSDIARIKRNLFGYHAYDRGPFRYATRFRTYRQGILSVAKRVHDEYLTPGGRYWSGFTTLRGMNLCYASSVRWAAKIAGLANGIDALVVTLKERRLTFGPPRLLAGPVAGTHLAVDVRWTARRGAVLPARIRFAVRWTPIALAEASADAPAVAPAPAWTLVRRSNRAGHAVRLALSAPTDPGLWRLEIAARDSDGMPLPATDDPPIKPLVVRVAAAREASLSVSLDGSAAANGASRLTVAVRSLGRLPVGGVHAGARTAVEAWALPLDPSRRAFRLASVPLRTALASGQAHSVSVPVPAMPAVVVVRLAGNADAVDRSLPAAALVTRDTDGRAALAPLSITSPRDDVLLGRVAPVGRIAFAPAAEPGTLDVTVGGEPDPDTDLAVAAMEGASGHSSVMVRSIAADPARPGTPTGTVVALPKEPPMPAHVAITGLPAGVRLVVAGIIAADGTPVDPTTLQLAWVPIAAVGDAGPAPH